MNIRKIFTRKSGKVQLSSMEQLQKDFGEFPPNPLKTRRLDASRFTIIHMNRIDKYLFDLKNTFKLRSYIIRNPDDGYVMLLEENFPNKKEGFDKLRNLEKTFVEDWEQFGIFTRIMFILLCISISPLIILFLLYHVAKLLHTVSRAGDEFKTLGGFYSPLPHNRAFIYINAEKRVESDFHLEHIITHEHIHLLQTAYRVAENDFGQPAKYIRAPNFVLSDEYSDNSGIRYLLEKDEVEARLHEVVLSIYRKYRALPLTVPAFINLLALNEQIYITLIDQNFSLPIDEDCKLFDEMYETRSTYVGFDLYILMDSMRDRDMSIRFALEVLTTMYANLLRYYGDEDASLRFGRQIQRPNLYDRLYLNR